jgi:hypothetical protein
MMRTSRHCARPLILLVTIVAFCGAITAAQPRPDPWDKLKYSTAWIQLGDFTDAAMTTPCPSDCEWPLFSGGPWPPQFTGAAQLPKAGAILDVKAAVPLWITEYQETGEVRRLEAPARSAWRDNEHYTGVDLAPGDRVRVMEVFIDDTMLPERRIVLARVTPVRNAQRSTAEARVTPRIRWLSSGLPIPPRLEPTDEVVEITKIEHVHSMDLRHERPDETVARLAGHEGIVVAQVTRLAPFLTDDDSWIDTRVQATAVEILKNQSVFPKRSFEVLIGSGEMRLKGALVRAGSYPLLRVGSRYVFFTCNYDDVLRFCGIFEVGADDRVQPVRTFEGRGDDQPLSPPNPFAGMSLSQALRMIRRHVRGQ